MDKYKKLMCVKGLIMSLDEQIYRVDQKGDIKQAVYQDILTQYWDAVKEQLGEAVEYNFDIKVNGIDHAHYTKTISFDEVARFVNLKCRNQDLTITYSGGVIEKSGHSGTLLPNVEIEVTNDMVFNAVMTNKA